MHNIEALVRGRKSVRTFDGGEIDSETLQKLTDFMEEIDNPYEIPVEFKLLDGKNYDLNSQVVSGTSLFVGAKAERVKNMEEAVGYSFETLVLYAQSLGIGTVIIGGTMDRPAFERAIRLKRGERMPCISPLGHASEKKSLRERMMRKAIKADSREPFEALFFDGEFGKPLTPEKAGELAFPLEMVRLAPSAVNKQPWRVVVGNNAAHFYLRRSKGFISYAAGDMQKIDLGIALCHFALAAEEKNIKARFSCDDPKIAANANCEYIASYLLS